MRKAEEILEEVRNQCYLDGCQYWNSIAILSIDKAINETKEEVIEELHNIINNINIAYYSILDGFEFSRLKDYIIKLENSVK